MPCPCPGAVNRESEGLTRRGDACSGREEPEEGEPCALHGRCLPLPSGGLHRREESRAAGGPQGHRTGWWAAGEGEGITGHLGRVVASAVAPPPCESPANCEPNSRIRATAAARR